MKDLINFLKKYGGWQWYGNDKATRNIVNKLVIFTLYSNWDKLFSSHILGGNYAR